MSRLRRVVLVSKRLFGILPIRINPLTRRRLCPARVNYTRRGRGRRCFPTMCNRRSARSSCHRNERRGVRRKLNRRALSTIIIFSTTCRITYRFTIGRPRKRPRRLKRRVQSRQRISTHASIRRCATPSRLGGYTTRCRRRLYSRGRLCGVRVPIPCTLICGNLNRGERSRLRRATNRRTSSRLCRHLFMKACVIGRVPW